MLMSIHSVVPQCFTLLMLTMMHIVYSKYPIGILVDVLASYYSIFTHVLLYRVTN